MTALIDNRAGCDLEKEYEEVIIQTIAQSLAYEEFTSECEVSVSIVSDDEIKSLNKEYRDKDSVTDVLSFAQLTFSEDEFADVNEKDEIILGDIVISLHRAQEQSKEYGHSLKRELAFLTAHSMLHLLGYDHMEPEEESQMIEKQKAILDRLGITRN